MTFFYVFFWTWVAAVVLIIWQILAETVLKKYQENTFGHHELPDEFMDWQDRLSDMNLVVVGLQTFGLWAWLLGNGKFRVTPRLQKLVLRRSAQPRRCSTTWTWT